MKKYAGHIDTVSVELHPKVGDGNSAVTKLVIKADQQPIEVEESKDELGAQTLTLKFIGEWEWLDFIDCMSNVVNDEEHNTNEARLEEEVASCVTALKTDFPECTDYNHTDNNTVEVLSKDDRVIVAMSVTEWENKYWRDA